LTAFCSVLLFRFCVTRCHRDSNETAEAELITHLYRMFLLGATNYKRKLEVTSDSVQLDVVMDVLKVNPTRFDILEEFEVDLHNPDNDIGKILQVNISAS